MNETKTPGTYGFAGVCAPKPYTQPWETFSVGIFEWVSKANGQGVKRGKVKVRVKGFIAGASFVEAKAKEIIKLLDAGTYQGKRNIDLTKTNADNT